MGTLKTLKKNSQTLTSKTIAHAVRGPDDGAGGAGGAGGAASGGGGGGGTNFLPAEVSFSIHPFSIALLCN